MFHLDNLSTEKNVADSFNWKTRHRRRSSVQVKGDDHVNISL